MFLAIICGVEWVRRKAALWIAKRIVTPAQYRAYVRSFYPHLDPGRC